MVCTSQGRKEGRGGYLCPIIGVLLSYLAISSTCFAFNHSSQRIDDCTIPFFGGYQYPLCISSELKCNVCPVDCASIHYAMAENCVLSDLSKCSVNPPLKRCLLLITPTEQKCPGYDLPFVRISADPTFRVLSSTGERYAKPFF